MKAAPHKKPGKNLLAGLAFVGKLQLKLDDLQDSQNRRNSWLDKAKREAGYHPNVSFDEVWAEALAALKATRGDFPNSKFRLQ